MEPMKASAKLTLFWMSFLLVGVVLALFFGIGWLFLMLTLRRAIVFIPSVENQFRERLLGLPPRRPPADPQMQRVTQLLGVVTVLVWAGITILAFAQLNVPLIHLLQNR